ncbi:MAG: zinc-binding dehydrogenase [Ignavibacteria bacterium]|nr:zinc-binding dehydrogenase [Ignavibacteria bacterium]
MKAVRLVAEGRLLQTQEIRVPSVGQSDVLVRVKAAGVCHSDAHYRAGVSPAGPLPITLGHEVAGVVEQVGSRVRSLRVGDRVCVHYLVTCGDCKYCSRGNEQFCPSGQMIGKHRDGGYAEELLMPARSIVPLPDEISFEHGAVLMCSSSTSFHALRKGRLTEGETVAIFGAGGLGMSAIQLAKAFGASRIYAVDINRKKLELAERFGAIPLDAAKIDPVSAIRQLSQGKGVDVALELVGLPQTARQAVLSLANLGRAVMVGLTDKSFEVYPYAEILGKEAEIIGSSDHLLSELPQLLDLARQKKLDLSEIVTDAVPLEADAINAVLDELEQFGDNVRTVITP